MASDPKTNQSRMLGFKNKGKDQEVLQIISCCIYFM